MNEFLMKKNLVFKDSLYVSRKFFRLSLLCGVAE
jgi:hypothetical protein